MAYELKVLDISLVAGEDLTEHQYKLVDMDSDGNVVLGTAGELGIGVLQNNPNVGEVASVRVYGVSKVVAGEEIGYGDIVEIGADGVGMVKDSGVGMGISLANPGEVSELFSMLIDRGL